MTGGTSRSAPTTRTADGYIRGQTPDVTNSNLGRESSGLSAERVETWTMSTPHVMPGAEPMSHEGTTDVGVLVLHGFTGNPISMRGLADAMVAAGHSVEMPRLPGHGTTIDDMLDTTWADWTARGSSSSPSPGRTIRSHRRDGIEHGRSADALVGIESGRHRRPRVHQPGHDAVGRRGGRDAP